MHNVELKCTNTQHLKHNLDSNREDRVGRGQSLIGGRRVSGAAKLHEGVWCWTGMTRT